MLAEVLSRTESNSVSQIIAAVDIDPDARLSDVEKVLDLIKQVNARKLASRASNLSAITDLLTINGYKASMPSTSWKLEVTKVSERHGFSDRILSID